MSIDVEHTRNAAIAKAAYLNARTASTIAAEWHFELRRARRLVGLALRESDHLRDVTAALRRSGSHMRVFRHLMAPPMSQDQFKLQCPSWPKSSEKTGSPLTAKAASEAEAVFDEWRDRGTALWLASGVSPSAEQLREVMIRVAPLIAHQNMSTGARTLLAYQQEKHVLDLLLADGWTQLPSAVIDTRAAVPKRHFMHKTNFATKTSSAQEVDIALGLGETYVAAMECKVTNDETNSVKRINDILKKANAWRQHWGSFVETAALLQGVVAPKDVQRLTDDGVHVFWSHDLEAFRTWLNAALR